MGSHVLFLTISCIVALPRSNPRADDSPNITVMKKNYEAWCIAQGEDAFSGLSWVSPETLSVTENEFQMSNGMKQDCEVLREKCEQWSGWNIRNSLDYPMPEVLDYRWNNLTLARAKETFNVSNRIDITSSKKVLELTLSILGKQDAYIYLCESESSFKCYWIILGGWSNKRNVIRRCTSWRECPNITEEKLMSPLRSDEWIHIKVRFDTTESALKVFLENKEILNYQNNSLYNIKYLNVRSYVGEIAYFRYHFYSYFWASRDEPLARQYYTPSQKRVCWSIVYSIYTASPSGYLEVKLEYKNDLYPSIIEKLEYTEYKWEHKKVEFTLEAITEVRIVITGKNGEDFAVGGIMQCNPDGNSRKSMVQISPKSDLKCQSLEYPKQKLELRNPGAVTDCGNDCTLNCKKFDIPSIKDCKNTVICKKIGNVENTCFCSSGFTDLYCNTACGGNLYGVGCTQECGNCRKSYYQEKCNVENGRCDNGCVEGYRMPFCKSTYPYLKNPPSRCTATSTSITVTVDNFETLGELITPVKYILQYKLSSDAVQWINEGTYDFNISRTSIIQNLLPGKEYQIRAILIEKNNEMYSGSKVPIKTCGITCDHPTRENIKIQASTRSLTVDWQVGEKNYRCPANLYRFIVERHGRTVVSDNVKKVPFDVNDLDPFSNYTWRLLYDNDELYSSIIQTMEGAPSSPLNVIAVTLSAQEIKVTWKHPNETRGKLKHFKLQVILTSSGLKKAAAYNKTKIKDVIHDEKEYTFNIDDLFPSSEYSVSVYGVTVSEGDKAHTTVRTHIAAPMLGTHLQLKEDSISDTSFQVIIPAADEFLTKQSAYIVIVTSESELMYREKGLIFEDETVKQQILKANVKNNKYSWVAAEIQPESEKIFTIGDDKTQISGIYIESAVNVPLVMGNRYQVTLVAVNQWQNDYSFSSVKLEKSVISGIRPDESNYVALWVILVLLLICIPIVLFYILKRRKNLKKDGDQLELKGEDALSGNSQNGMGDAVIIPDMESEDMPDEPILPPSQRFSSRIAIDDLEQYVKSGLASGELQRQHALFPRGQTRPWDYGQLRKNKSKNRYGKLAAYDETRVVLKKLPDDPFSDYINANYIDGYKSPKFYIATQGPKHNTVVDFWRMIWQENVHVIAMLANIFEDGKVKCEKYWPELGQEFTQGAVTIMNVSDKTFADFTFRVLNVSSKGKSRKVHHLHFTSWPDHSVPMYPQSVASYLKKLLAIPPGSGAIVVHCSAGVGRTGTIILCDICLRMAAAEGSVDMLGYLQQIREQRANLVDSLDQYKLVHLVLLECLVTEPSSYPCDASFEKRVQELINSGVMKTQFRHLSDIRWQDQALKSASKKMQGYSPAQTDPTKNRNLNIVPESYCRVYISPFPYDDPNSDYINAVYVDGFRVKDQFIVTQFPLESTISDFWRLISEKKISLIVVLNEIDTSICSFWPAELKNSMNPIPQLTITKKQEDDAVSWKTHTISLVDSGVSRQVYILHLKGWKTNSEIPLPEDVMIGLWEEAERLYSGKDPIVVCCLDGAMTCGYFVALAFLIEKIKLEQQCDVCQAVRTVRQNREQLVPNIEQFESLYKAAMTYLESFQTYSNFS